MALIVLCIGVLLTLFFPVLAIPFNIFGLIIFTGKIRKGFGLLLAISLAIVAYFWEPNIAVDLTRHQQQMALLTDFNTTQLGIFIRDTLEPMHYLIMFGIAQGGDYDLLQFLVILCGYFELFWIICDLADAKRISRGLFALLFFYVFTSVQFINFASGLWFNFAVINISLGMYLSFFRNAKYLQYVFYVLAICLHMGTLYMLIPTLVFKHFKVFREGRVLIIVLIFLTSLSFGGIMLALGNIFGDDSAIATMFSAKYDSYFINDAQFGGLHTGWNLYLPVANVLISLMVAIWCYRKAYLSEYSSFLIYTIFFILGSIISAGIFVRYGFLVAILVIPLMIEFFRHNKNKKSFLVLVTSVFLLISLQLVKSFIQMESVQLTSQIEYNITNSIFYIIDNNEGRL